MATNPYIGLQKLSPRLKRAIEIYATTQAATKKEASAAVGLHPNVLTMATASPLVQEYMKQVSDHATEKILDMRVLLDKLALRGLQKIEETMEAGSSELLRLKAAQDLADRGTQTMKGTRLQVESAFVVDAESAKHMAEAMVLAAQIREQNRALAVGSDDRTGSFADAVPIPAIVSNG